MKKQFISTMVLLLTLMMLSETSFSQIKMESNGDVVVGQHWGQTPYKEFDVRGEMFVSHVPRNGVSGWNYVGCWFTNHSYQYNGNTVYRPIFQPQWGNNYWIGNANSRFWQIHGQAMYADNFFTTSDERYKENFEPVKFSLDRIMQLQPYTFDYIFKSDDKVDDTVNREVEAATKNHIGFKAQDLKKDFPHLVVYDEENDKYSVNYIGLIPELVAAMKEQNQIIEELTSEIEMVKGNCCNTSLLNEAADHQGSLGEENGIVFSKSKLEQNQPNPFSQKTVINYYLADNAKNAAIYIYDMNGKQIDRFQLQDKGQQGITLQKNQLEAGMYYYSLIVDGQEISTKKMILMD